jgi:hypothetical protein
MANLPSTTTHCRSKGSEGYNLSELFPIASETGASMPHRRSAFFISDRTGITAESLGNTLLTQFDTLDFKREAIPFIDTVEKPRSLPTISAPWLRRTISSLVFTSIVNPEVREVLHIDNALVVDFFDTFIGELEAELGQKASLTLGKAHGVGSEEKYDHRIEAVNFSLNHDDGVKLKDLAEADVILVGVSAPAKRRPACTWRCNTASRPPTTRSPRKTWTAPRCPRCCCPTATRCSASPSTRPACTTSARSAARIPSTPAWTTATSR